MIMWIEQIQNSKLKIQNWVCFEIGVFVRLFKISSIEIIVDLYFDSYLFVNSWLRNSFRSGLKIQN